MRVKVAGGAWCALVLFVACAKPDTYDPPEAGPDGPGPADAGAELPPADAVAPDGPVDQAPAEVAVDTPTAEVTAPDAGPDLPSCPATCWRDMDGDMFGDPTAPQLTCTDAGQCELGYVANHADCYDGNPNAKPLLLIIAQPPFRDRDRGDGKWDYNCDSVEEKEVPATWTGCAPDCSMVPATPLPTPACGQEFEHTTCEPGLGGQQCGPRRVRVMQRCR